MFPRCLWLFAYVAVAGLELNAAPPPGYYAFAQSQTGGVLRLALHGIIKGHTVLPYSSSTTNDTLDALNLLDADPANTNNVILIYSRRSDPKTNYNVSGGWNREHLWPDSYGIDGHVPYYSDLHNLRPEDRSVNGARGNKFYDLSDTNDPGYQNPGFVEAPLTSTDSDSWEPPAKSATPLDSSSPRARRGPVKMRLQTRAERRSLLPQAWRLNQELLWPMS